jgi:hypothetical protein
MAPAAVSDFVFIGVFLSERERMPGHTVPRRARFLRQIATLSFSGSGN